MNFTPDTNKRPCIPFGPLRKFAACLLLLCLCLPVGCAYKGNTNLQTMTVQEARDFAEYAHDAATFVAGFITLEKVYALATKGKAAVDDDVYLYPSKETEKFMSLVKAFLALSDEEIAEYLRQAAAEERADAAAVTDEKVMALLFPESPDDGTDLDSPNITTQALGEALKTNKLAAVVTGNLSGGGIYGFNVNLSSGSISSGTMVSNTGMYNAHSGTGLVSGNNFSVGNFQGTSPSGGIGSNTSLTGTAANGFGSVGDIDASGTYNVTDGLNGAIENGTITSGERIK